jgi:kynurenine formamidase
MVATAAVDELPLDWFYGEGVLLDFSKSKRAGEKISTAELLDQLKRIGVLLKNGNIALIGTGAAGHFPAIRPSPI